MNHVDISPNWAGILMGITNTFANLTGFAAPYVAGLLINDDVSLNGSLIKVGKNSLCGIMSVYMFFFCISAVYTKLAVCIFHRCGDLLF